MTITASSSYNKMSRGRGKTSGWAAFDLKQRQKPNLEADLMKDPFPSIANTLTPLLPSQNLLKNNKPFSSVLLPSVDFAPLPENGKCQNPTLVGNSSSDKNVNKNSRVLALNKLKELHHWADNSLIEDILAAADNNMDRASNLLKAMVSNDSFKENKQTTNGEINSTSNDLPCDQMIDKSFSSRKTMNLADLSSTLEDCLKYNGKELMDENDSFGRKLPDESLDKKLIMERLKSVPVEPEWEEDDVYLIHRKDALKMMRSASQHSRAANNAFLRGDHVSAQQHSMKAREEWLAAERLNAKAAKEILSIRNSENDLWKLDLHGLHATEAIHALQRRLQQIETQEHTNHSASPNKVKMENGIVHSPSLEFFSCMDSKKLDMYQASSRKRPTSLEVITGIGNHSRGHAAIPTAVKSYLNECRYRFDELRPGVITVRPKFCLQ